MSAHVHTAESKGVREEDGKLERRGEERRREGKGGNELMNEKTKLSSWLTSKHTNKFNWSPKGTNQALLIQTIN